MSEGGVIGKLVRGLAAGRGVLSAWVGVNDARSPTRWRAKPSTP